MTLNYRLPNLGFPSKEKYFRISKIKLCGCNFYRPIVEGIIMFLTGTVILTKIRCSVY